MTVKKSLENRIRGWFPQEPRLIGLRVKTNPEVKQQPIVIPSGYDINATMLTGVGAILIAFINLPINLLILVFGRSPSQVFWFTAFMVIGVILGLIVTKGQLNQLSKEHKIGGIVKNAKWIILLLVPFFAVLILYYASLDALAGAGFLPWVCISSFWLSRWLLMRAYEKRENMRIMGSLWGQNLIVIPNPPDRIE